MKTTKILLKKLYVLCCCCFWKDAKKERKEVEFLWYNENELVSYLLWTT